MKRRMHRGSTGFLLIAGAILAGAVFFGLNRNPDRTAPFGAPSQAANESPDAGASAQVATGIGAPAKPFGSDDDATAQPGPSEVADLASMTSAAKAIINAGHLGPRLDGSSLVELIPPSLIEVARSTVWDERMVESLEQLLLLAFDADGDGVLDDFERITAVRSMRDAMWSVPPDDALTAAIDVGANINSPRFNEAALSSEDLRLHHNVDEARRLDHATGRQSAGRGVIIDDAFRADVLSRFQLEDDGQLTADEFARFMHHYNRSSSAADLNLDGRIDETDLRLFLDIASPLEDE